MDFIEARLHACCSSLGFFDEVSGKYVKEPDCELSCKELIRSLRREDDTRHVRRKIGFLKVFENDLISIICNYPEETELFDSVIRLMQNLSSPAILCFGNIPTDPQFRSYFLELERYLRSYKAAFTNENVIYNIGIRVKTILESDDAEEEEAQLLLERILILFRNILHIDSNPDDENRTDDDACIHDQIIWAMQKTGVEAILKYLATNEDQSKWCMHILEIIFHMLRDQSPELLASTPSPALSDVQEHRKSQKESEIEAKELCALLVKEKEQRKCTVAVANTRHSRFGGTYYVRNLKALNPNNDIIFHGPQNKAKYISFDDMKADKKRPKRLQPVTDRGVPRRSTKLIRQFLKEFVNDLLEHAFNNLMHASSDAIQREKIQHNDESYFLWSMGFFLEFNRCSKFRPELVSEVLSTQIFSYIHLKMSEYYEMMMQEKKVKFVAISWAQRMHFALKAFSELLKSCEKMGNQQDKDIQKSADILKRNLFYNSEYRDLFISFMQRFDQTKMSKCYLRDLIDANHTFLKMLEDFVSKKKLIVKQKGKKKKKKKTTQDNMRSAKNPAKSGATSKSGEKESENNSHENKQEFLESLWENIAPSLSGILQGRIKVPEETMMPFDPLSEIPLEDQKRIAIGRLQRLIRSVQETPELKDENASPNDEDLPENLTAMKVIELLRECRKVWPEGDLFGALDSSIEDEFMVLRSIHFAETVDLSNFRDLGKFKDFELSDAVLRSIENTVENEQHSDAEENAAENNDALQEELLDAGLISDSSSDDDENRPLDSNEQYFDFHSHLHYYAKWEIVRCYAYILQFFKTNFSQTNKAALKMLHRLACDLNMPGLLFQASLFRTFREVLRDASIRTRTHKINIDNTTKELVVFAKYIIKQFVRAAQKNKNIFMELIFWKNATVACEIVEGYGTYVNHGKSEAFRIIFSEDDNIELIRLFNQYQQTEQDEAQGGVVEYIMSNFSRQLSKPKVVANQLKSLNLVSDLNELRMVSGRENAGVWRPEHETELKFLWEEFKGSEDPLTEIYNAMVHKKPKVRIIQKLLMSGMATSKNEIVKPDIWPETLITELTRLYEFYKSERDPIRGILDSLTTPKSRKQIINKLIDIKLISNVAEIKPQKSQGSNYGKSSSRNQPKQWTESEIGELKELFREYKKLKHIIENKTFEASRKQVIEKLKELNLYSQCTGTKKGAKGMNFLESNNMIQDGDFEEEMSRHAAKRNNLSMEMSKRRKQEFVKIVQNVVKSEMSEALEWLKSSLRNAVEAKSEFEGQDGENSDEEMSDPVSFPLVPNGEVTERAIECHDFKRVLDSLGISPPTTNEEIFWRIPAYMTSAMISEKIKLLESSLQQSQNEENIAVINMRENETENINETENVVLSNLLPLESVEMDSESDNFLSEEENEGAVEEKRQKFLAELRRKSMKRKAEQNHEETLPDHVTSKQNKISDASDDSENDQDNGTLKIVESDKGSNLSSNEDESAQIPQPSKRRKLSLEQRETSSPGIAQPRIKKKFSRLQRVDLSDNSDDSDDNYGNDNVEQLSHQKSDEGSSKEDDSEKTAGSGQHSTIEVKRKKTRALSSSDSD